MLFFNDLFKYAEKYPQITLGKTFSEIQTTSVNHLASRSVLGAIIVPLCFTIACLVSGFDKEYPGFFSINLVILVLGAILRVWSIKEMAKNEEGASYFLLKIFLVACCLMGATWGAGSAMFLYVYKATFPFFLIMILTAGITAGAVTSFSSWRCISYIYLILMNGPTILMGIYLWEVEMLSVITAYFFFLIYMLDQVRHRNDEYWNGLIKSYLFEKQAEELTQVNEQLAGKMAEQGEYQEELQVSRAKMRELFDNSQDAIIIHSLKGTILDVNRTMLEMFSLSRSEAIDVSLMRELSASDNSFKGLRQLILKVSAGESVDFEWHAKKKNRGELFWVHVNMRKVNWQDDEIIFTTVRDINEQKVAEFERDHAKNSLVKSEGYLKAILENTSKLMFCKDLRGKYLTINKPFEALAKMSREEIEGKSDLEVFSEENAKLLSDNDWEVQRKQKIVEFEGVFQKHNEEKNLLISKFPLYGSKGEVYAIGGVCTDITSLKEAYYELEKANKVKTEFLANMSHELRTPMHGILSFARLAIKRIETASKENLLSYMQMIVTSGGHLLDLLEDLLDLSRLETGQMVYDRKDGNITVDLNDVVNEFNGVVEEKSISLVYDSSLMTEDGAVGEVNYDTTRMRQVIRNLLANAVKFSDPNQQIRVTLESDQLTFEGKDVRAVKVKVIDQGMGIPEDELDLVFGKFVQGSLTKNGAGGTGLGLSICKQIVEDHGGKIWAERNPEGGTIIAFILPLSVTEAEVDIVN